MIATETARTVVLILLGLSVLWIVVIIIKNDMQTIVRALLVAALLGLAFFYLNGTKLDKLSFTAIKYDLFPVKTRAYAFKRIDGTMAGSPMTTYIFEDPGPPLALVLMDGGKYMAIKDIRGVNSVLEYLGLPPVSKGVPELSSITGQGLDTDKYRWDDYAHGVLVIDRGISHDVASMQAYPSIMRITIRAR